MGVGEQIQTYPPPHLSGKREPPRQPEFKMYVIFTDELSRCALVGELVGTGGEFKVPWPGN